MNWSLFIPLFSRKLCLPAIIIIILLITGEVYSQTTDNRKPADFSVKELPFTTNANSPNLPSQSACFNSNFSEGNFDNWSGCWGVFHCPQNPPNAPPNSAPACDQNQGINYTNGRFVIIPGPGGPDPIIGAALNTCYPGEAYVARIGDITGGGNVDELRYQITVGASNNFFVYRYAAVLQDINHDPKQRPRLTIEIKDPATGEMLDSICGYYNVYANMPGSTGWVLTNGHYWKDWTTVGMDLSPWDGQTIEIAFTVNGCCFTAHKGYAYISAYCSQMTIDIAGCEGSNTVTMTAPPGFAQYSWEGPKCPTCPLPLPIVGTTQTVVITNAVTGYEYYLDLTAANGCTVNKATSVVKFTSINPGFTANINCIGNPSTFTDTSHISQNPTSVRVWDFGDGTLPVTMNTPTVTHTFAVGGTYPVKLKRFSTDPCVDSVIVQITAATNPPVITNLPVNKQMCSGDNAGINLLFSLPSAAASWTSSVLSGSASITKLPATQTGTLINDMITNTGTGDAVIRYKIRPSIGDCLGDTTVLLVTVHPLPLPAMTGPQSVCLNSTGNKYKTDPGMTGYTWNVNGGTINGTSTADSIMVTWNVAGSRVVTVTYVDGNGCIPATPTTFIVNVKPLPDVTVTPAAMAKCSGQVFAATFTTSLTTLTTYQWSVSLPLPPNVSMTNTTGTGSINEVITNTGTSPQNVVFNIMPTSLGCSPAAPTTYTVTVYPIPDVNVTPSTLTICSGTSAVATFSTSVTTATTYQWTVEPLPPGVTIGNSSGTGSIGEVITNPGLSVENVVFKIIPTSNGCSGTPFYYTVNVKPTPHVSHLSGQIYCNAASAPATTVSSLVTVPVTFAWNNSNPAIGLAGSGSGNIPAFTVVNTGQVPVTATITITPTAGECVGPDSSYIVKVNPTADVDQPGSQIVCNNSQTTQVAFTTNRNGGTTTYSWVNDTPSIGLAATGNGTIGVFAATNTGNSPVTATISVTPHFLNGGLTCDGPAKSFTITVNPTAQVNQPVSQVLCNNQQTGAILFTTDHSGGTTTYSWTNDLPGIGLAGSGTGDIAAFTAVNNGTSPVVAHISVTPAFTNGSVTCSGPAKSFTITVNPSAQVNQPDNQVVCNNSSTSAINFTTDRSGGVTSYTWTNDLPAIGLASSGNGNISAFTAINAGTSPVTANIIVFPHFTNNGVTCDGPGKSLTITVNPTAALDQPQSVVICNGNQTAQISFSTVNTGGNTSYSWTNDTPGIGLAATGSGNISSFTVTNAGLSPVVATIVVIPSFTNNSVTCTGPSKSFTIIVNPSAQANQPANIVICNGGLVSPVNFTTNASGGTTTYNWTNDNPSIGLAAGGGGNISSFNAVNTGSTPVVANITVSPSFENGGTSCPGINKGFSITVNPTAQVNKPADQVICNGGTTSTVTYSTINSGGTTTYTWTNDTPSIGLPASGTGDINAFSPANISSSPVIATITVTPHFLNGAVTCDGPSKNFTFTINPSAQVNAIAGQVVCNSNQTNDVVFSTGNGGGITTYTWVNDTPAIGLASSGNGNIPKFTTVNSGNSPVTATVNVTPHFSNGGVTCDGPLKSFTIVVNPSGQVIQPLSQVICNGAQTSLVVFNTDNSGGSSTYSWTNDTPGIGLAANGTGNVPAIASVNAGSTPIIATIVVTPTFTNGSVSCQGPVKTFTFTINLPAR